MDDDWVQRLKKLDIVIATGEYDTLVKDNREFLGLLQSKGIAAHGEFWPGVFGHDWPYWREHLPRFVP
jgi:esterase/lipase superfamily enzyme